MPESVSFMKKYYSEAAWEQRRNYYENGPSPEWLDLWRDANALLNEDPAGTRRAGACGSLAAPLDPGIQWRSGSPDGLAGRLAGPSQLAPRHEAAPGGAERGTGTRFCGKGRAFLTPEIFHGRGLEPLLCKAPASQCRPRTPRADSGKRV